MRWTTPVLALVLMTASASVFLAGASACADRVTAYGGVVGSTEAYAVDSANQACEPEMDAGVYADLLCDYLMGVDCATMPGEILELVNWPCAWLLGEDCT